MGYLEGFFVEEAYRRQGIAKELVKACQIFDIEIRYIALRSVKGEIRQNYYFFAKVDDEAKISMNSNEGKLQWFDLSEVNSLEMPYTAKYVLQYYCAVGIYNSQVYCGVADGNQVVFTELHEYK